MRTIRNVWRLHRCARPGTGCKGACLRSAPAPALGALDRVCPGLDVWVVPAFAQTVLGFDPKELQQQLEQNYPVRRKGDRI